MCKATYTKIFYQFPDVFWFDTEVHSVHTRANRCFHANIIRLLQMALYADSERGRYPVWQSLDHENFFPGSGIIFVTVTVSYPIP